MIVTIGAGWILPPAYPNFSTTWLEFVGTEGALFVDDSHRDTVVQTMRHGTTFPLSTMPGERIGHVYAGPMERETLYFLEAVVGDRDVLVTAHQARRVMEVYQAADLSAERNDRSRCRWHRPKSGMQSPHRCGAERWGPRDHFVPPRVSA